MKKDTRREESFIFAIYNMRHNVNEILLILPFVPVLLFSIIGAPIITVLCDISLLWLPLLIVGPIFCVLCFYFLRKKLIMNHFVKIRDISDRVELSVVSASDFEAEVSGKVFMFAYSEYMEVVLYNWLLSLNVIGEGKLKLYKVLYEKNALVYLAVCEDELNIPEQSGENYAKETASCLLLSDMLRGKAVNTRLSARLSQNGQNADNERL